MSLAGFGGVLVFARRAIVEQHRWMTAEEFNETFALCHFLPGPNIVNLTMVFGSRFRGIAGGLAAFAGLLGPPTIIMTVLATLYARFGDVDALRRILAGISCVAVGLLPNVLAVPLARLEPYGMLILIGILILLPLLGSQLGLNLDVISVILRTLTGYVLRLLLMVTGNV